MSIGTWKRDKWKGQLNIMLPEFDDWSEAYSYCREMNHPVVVIVTENGSTEKAKIYPSGACKTTWKRVVE